MALSPSVAVMLECPSREVLKVSCPCDFEDCCRRELELCLQSLVAHLKFQHLGTGEQSNKARRLRRQTGIKNLIQVNSIDVLFVYLHIYDSKYLAASLK